MGERSNYLCATFLNRALFSHSERFRQNVSKKRKNSNNFDKTFSASNNIRKGNSADPNPYVNYSRNDKKNVLAVYGINFTLPGKLAAKLFVISCFRCNPFFFVIRTTEFS